MSAALPPLYDRWLTAALGTQLEAEPRATCQDCAMLTKPDQPALETAFAPTTKCCTFYPNLTSFAAGGVLADEQSPAAQLIVRRIASGVGVTPFGISVPGVYRTLYNEATKLPGSFGRVPSLRCPFYIENGGLCGIHRHRDAICSTWFCKYERGARGRIFWSVVKNLLKRVERALQSHCIATLDLGAEAFELNVMSEPFKTQLDEHDLNRTVDVAAHRRLWGRYAGRERLFYLECAQLVAGIEWAQLVELAGVEAKSAQRLLQQLSRNFTQLPTTVARGKSGLVQLSPMPGKARLRHSTLFYDFRDVPIEVIDALPELEGRPLREALAELQGRGVAIDEELVRALIDYQVLVANPLSDGAS